MTSDGVKKMKRIGGHLSAGPWKSRLWMALVLVFAVAIASSPASGFEYGEVATGTSSKRVDNYRLIREPAQTGDDSSGGILIERDYFPLYGSREERIDKPWLRAFSYDGTYNGR